VAWELASWLEGNAWESEDGPTKTEFCLLEYWDRAFTWIGSHRVAIEDVGDDETPACTRVFDLTQATTDSPGHTRQAAEIAVLDGPRRRFFSDGTTLFSVAEDGLSLWDPATGARAVTVPGFIPVYYHPVAHEFIEVNDTSLRHCLHS
jgi:hypothetical protein